MNTCNIAWAIFDQYLSKEDIRDCLLEAGVKGMVGDPDRCPLALATGWSVDGWYRDHLDYAAMELTDAEKRFVEAFDEHEYPELELK